MPIFSLLPFAKPAFNIAQSLLSKQKKPKREDFVPSTDFIRSFVADLRSRKESSEVQNLLLQPELRRIGAEGRTAFRDIEKSFARTGAPEGAIAEARTGIAKTTIQGISEATGKARALQLQESRRLEDRIDRALLQEGSIQSRGDLLFRRAETGFKESERRRKIGILGGFADLAVAGLGQVGKSKALKESLLNRAKSEGILPPEATFEDLQQTGLEQFGIEPGTGAAGEETLRGLIGIRDISAEAGKKFGEFAPEFINQAISNIGLTPADIKSGDFSKIEREIKNVQLNNFKNLLQSPELSVDTLFEFRAATEIDEKQFNKLLSSIKKATGQELSTVRRQGLDIFTSDDPPEEKIKKLKNLLSGEIGETDSKSTLGLIGKVQTIQSQVEAAGRREKVKRVDVAEGTARISAMIADINNTKLFPEGALGEKGLGLPSGVGEELREKGFDPEGEILQTKEQLRKILGKMQSDRKITLEEFDDYQSALGRLVEIAIIPTSILDALIPEFDTYAGKKATLLRRLRSEFIRIINDFDVTVETPQNASELSTGGFINQLRLLIGRGE